MILKFIVLVLGAAICYTAALILIVAVIFFRTNSKEFLYLIPVLIFLVLANILTAIAAAVYTKDDF